MKEQQTRKVAEKVARKDKVMTSGGPTMETEDIEAIKNKFKNQKMVTKLELEKQMQMETAEKKAMRQIELQQERKQAEVVAARHLEAKVAQKEQKKETLAHFKEIWDAQRDLKSKNEEMENAF